MHISQHNEGSVALWWRRQRKWQTEILPKASESQEFEEN